jgi:hypothetical protein
MKRRRADVPAVLARRVVTSLLAELGGTLGAADSGGFREALARLFAVHGEITASLPASR